MKYQQERIWKKYGWYQSPNTDSGKIWDSYGGVRLFTLPLIIPDFIKSSGDLDLNVKTVKRKCGKKENLPPGVLIAYHRLIGERKKGKMPYLSDVVIQESSGPARDVRMPWRLRKYISDQCNHVENFFRANPEEMLENLVVVPATISGTPVEIGLTYATINGVRSEVVALPVEHYPRHMMKDKIKTRTVDMLTLAKTHAYGGLPVTLDHGKNIRDLDILVLCLKDNVEYGDYTYLHGWIGDNSFYWLYPYLY